MDRKTGAAVTLVLLAGAFHRGAYPSGGAGLDQEPAPAPAETSERAGAKPSPAADASPGFGAWTPVCKYFETDADGARTNSPDVAKQFCLDRGEGAAAHRTVLIATVPDPELTHLSMVFDRYVESLTWAAADGDLDKNRYSFNSYWFPWQPEDKPESDPEKRKAAEKQRERRVSMPGILFFRARDDPARLLLIFLVGETPTSGVNRIAFLSAWKYARALATDVLPICGSSACTGILGPSFTGSLPSLKRLLNGGIAEPLPQTVVISGAVTGEQADRMSSLAPAHFCTTIESEGNRQAALAHYLGDPPTGSFALLREDETLYGEGGESAGAKGGTPLVLRYPRGLARIRNMSGQLPGLNTLAPQNARYPELPLDLRDTGQDTIPSFGQQTPVSQEAVLFEITATLRREHIRFAGIIATDPLDALYLSRGIRALAPNIRIILFHADQLFARAAESWGLRGLLAVTSYPLISRNQFYNPTIKPRRTQFPDESAEGEYNALRRMFLPSPAPAAAGPRSGPDPWCSVVPVPSESADGDFLLDYTAPFTDDADAKHRPSVWIEVLGQNAWWPVAAYAPTEPSSLLKGPDPVAHKHAFTIENAPRLWFAFFWIVLSGCAAYVFTTGIMNSPLSGSFWGSAALRVFGWGFKPEIETRRRGISGMASATMAAMALALAVAAKASGLAMESGDLEFIAALVVACAAFMEAVWAAFGASRSWAAATLTWAILVATIGVAALNQNPDGHAFEFAGYRDVHLESGTSPIFPIVLLLAILSLCFWFRLVQLRIEEDRCACLPSAAGAFWERLRLPAHIVPPIGAGQALSAGTVILCWLLFLRPAQTLATLETPLYSRSVMFLSTAAVTLLTFASLRFLGSWRSLRNLLRTLERSPLRYAFSRLPKDFSWMSVWTGDPRPKLQIPMRALDVLRMVSAGASEISRIETAMESLNTRQTPSVYEDVDDLNTALNDASVAVEKYLSPLWDRGLSDTIASREKKDEAPREWAEQPERIVAEEFLALRFVSFIRYSLWVMRVFLEFLTYGFILLVAALTLYPFEAKSEIGIALVVIFVVIGGLVFMAFAEMDRDPLLSRLSDTKPNELSPNVIYRIVSFGALPLLTLLASQVPQIGNFLLSWVQPALQAAK